MKKSFELPQSILSQLNEMTKGYFLFYIDDQGIPKIQAHFDGPTDGLGLTKFVANYAEGLDQFNSMQIHNSVMPDDGDEGCGDPNCPDCGGE